MAEGSRVVTGANFLFRPRIDVERAKALGLSRVDMTAPTRPTVVNTRKRATLFLEDTTRGYVAVCRNDAGEIIKLQPGEYSVCE